MKTFIFTLLLCVPFFVFGQVVDTADVIRQVDSLIKVTGSLTGQGEFDKALEVNTAAEKLTIEKLGRETAAYGKCCHNRGWIFYNKGDYSESENWFLDAITIREKVFGKENATYAFSLSSLANVYLEMKKYRKAESYFFEAMAIQKKVVTKDTLNYVESLNNLAYMYAISYNFDKAESLYLEEIEICARVLGKKHPQYPNTLFNLAILTKKKGEYAKAELLYLEAKEIYAETLGKESRMYANCLNLLAVLYTDEGNYVKAEQYYLEAIEIYAKTIGKDHEHYAGALDNLGSLYMAKGEYDKAEPFMAQANEIYSKTLGKQNPDYAYSLENLAILNLEKGEYAKAEQYYMESLEILEKTIGKENNDYANCIKNLGSLYNARGEYVKAESLYLEAKDIQSKACGREHPEYASTLNKLATLYQGTNRISEATTHFLEMNELDRRLIEKSAAYSSEQQMLAYLHTFDNETAQFQSFSQNYPSSILRCSGFDNALFFNGLLLENSRHLARSVAEADSLTVDIYERWQGCQRRLANEYTKPLVERQFIAEVEEEAEGYEKTLTRNLPAFSEARKVPHWQEVQDHLPQGSVAVEFIHYQYFTPKPTDSTMYTALLLRLGDSEPQFIPLFEESSLDSLLQTQGERRAEYVSNLYSLVERGAKPLGQPQKSLYELLWQPLEKELAGVQTIYFSPSGLLHRLNIGAIPIPPSLGGGQGEADEETLADRYRLVELGSTRQLVVPSEVKVANQDALLFGGIKYDMDSTAISQRNAELPSETVASATRGELSFTYADSTLRGGTWNYLKWTEKEVAALEPIMKSGGIQATSRRGYAATEESFKAIGKGKPSPRILHIATHGFFFPDPQSAVRNPQSDEPVFKISDHPMIRSGLILAGGNHAWQTGKPIKPGMEDGILTAYEISQMNLSNTELVVLSACETGLGDIEGNEGVYGLQRAFKIAGAKYLIMSLWQVPDYQTQELMTTFYKRWLEDKMTIPDAFRSAQKEMREKYQLPYFWAGFVLVE